MTDGTMSPLALPLTIVADDLTGAADAVGAYGSDYATTIVFDPARTAAGTGADADIVAVDTASRYLAPEAAAHVVEEAVTRSLASGRSVFKKIDSLLRGNIGVELRAAASAFSDGREARPAFVLIAPAYPAVGRTTVQGVVHVSGAAAAACPFGGDVTEAVAAGGLRVGRVAAGLDPADLAEQVRALRTAGLDAAVVDASTDDDLERVAAAARLLAFPTLLAGSGGLAAHVLPHRPHSGTGTGTGTGPAAATAAGAGTASAHDAPSGKRVLTVIGSYSDLARSQLARVIDGGAHHHQVPIGSRPSQSLPADIDDHDGGDPGGDVVITPELHAPLDTTNALTVAAAIARSVVQIADRFDAIVLTGGETARAVIDAFGIDQLRVLGEIEPGVVLSAVRDDLPYLVTKAGAFGDAGTLARASIAVRSMTTLPTHETRTA